MSTKIVCDRCGKLEFPVNTMREWGEIILICKDEPGKKKAHDLCIKCIEDFVDFIACRDVQGPPAGGKL